MSEVRTAAQAGWRESLYNICAWEAGEDDPVVANLFAGTIQKVSLLEYALLKSFAGFCAATLAQLGEAQLDVMRALGAL